MSSINITDYKYTYSVNQQQSNGIKAQKPSYIPMVTVSPQKEVCLTEPTLIDNLSSWQNAITTWVDKVTGMDKVKEFNQLKDSLAQIMTQNKIKYSDFDLEYWAEIIDKNSKSSNLSKELLMALVQRETSFQKCIGSKTGNGPLQVTSVTVKDLFSDLNGGRLVHYNNMDKSMMDEILYKEDVAGNKVPRFNSYEALHDACANDDDLGMKVGIMCFKMKFVEVVARKKDISIAEAIDGLKSGDIELSKKEQKSLIKRALVNFNSVFTEEYAEAVLDSIAKISPNKEVEDFNIMKK